MDIFGAVVNVAHLTRRIVEIVQGAQDASGDRERLINAVFSASGVIAIFKSLAESSTEEELSNEFQELLSPQGALTQYQALLEKVLQKITVEKQSKRAALNKLEEGWKVMKWSWDKPFVESLLREIGDIKSTLNLVVRTGKSACILL